MFFPATMFETGQLVGGRYVIERLLGEGGMGAVYVARHSLVGKRVALKALHKEHVQSREMVRRFIREAKASARIEHENIVDVLDIGETEDGGLYLVMELLEGETLAQRLQKVGRLEIYEAADICGQVLLALDKAHTSGIVHRDIKPENVFLTTVAGRRDFVKVLDFGIAKFMDFALTGPGVTVLTKTGMMIGTPYYMSPEQARGDKVDHRTDIYAVGAVLYQAVTGVVPFQAENLTALLLKIITQAPAPPSSVIPGIPPQLEEVIEKAMAKRADDRFFSAAEFFACLQPFRAYGRLQMRGTEEELGVGREVAPLPPGCGPSYIASAPTLASGKRGVRRHSHLLFIAGAVVLATTLGVLGTLLFGKVFRNESRSTATKPVVVESVAGRAEKAPPVAPVTVAASASDPVQDHALTHELVPVKKDGAAAAAMQKPKEKAKKPAAGKEREKPPIRPPVITPLPPPPKEEKKSKRVITEEWDE